MESVLAMLKNEHIISVGIVIAVVATVVLILISLLRRIFNTKKADDHPSEALFVNSSKEEESFPSVFDDASLLLTIVVPCYNEEKRLVKGMKATMEYLESKSKKDETFTWEIIMVDDGSRDKTSELIMKQYVQKYSSDKIRLLKLFKNNGKGGAVRKGMVRGRGKYLLFADADGASAAFEIENMLAAIKKLEKKSASCGVVGSRAHLAEADSSVKRTPLRKFLMWGFHTFINLMLGGTEIKDTQCGFKLFTRDAARKLFPVQHIDRWAFDVELIYLANRLNIPLLELPITWEEIDGSTIDIVSDSLKMARDIVTIRLSYLLGIWKDQNQNEARAISSKKEKSTPRSKSKSRGRKIYS